MTRVKDGDTGVFVGTMLNEWAGAPLHRSAREFELLAKKAPFLDAFDVHRLAYVFTQIQRADNADEDLELLAEGPDMDEAINAYRSMGEAIAGHYIKGLPGKAQGWIAQAKRWFSDPGMGYYTATTFLSSLKSSILDLAERAPAREMDSLYTGPLAGIANFNNEFSRGMAEYLTVLGVSGALYMEEWFDAIRETGDIIHDSYAIARDVELTFFYLRYWQSEQTLGNTLELLSGEGFDRVDTALNSIRRLGLIRAHSSGVAVYVGAMPPLVIPEELRTDFVRVVHALISNGVKYRDMENVKKKGERRVSLVSAVDGPSLRISVMDNGRGEKDIQRHLAPEKGGGLAVAKRIADRNGWRLDIGSKKGVGTQASVVIDTGAWGKAPDPVPGSRTTLPGPVPPHSGGGLIASGWSPGLLGASMMAGLRPIN